MARSALTPSAPGLLAARWRSNRGIAWLSQPFTGHIDAQHQQSKQDCFQQRLDGSGAGRWYHQVGLLARIKATPTALHPAPVQLSAEFKMAVHYIQ
jgi:hypothetical protein